jgi:hypothetical protein
MTNEEGRAPRAFLSYSHDDDAHKAWVRGFAERLRGDGVESILDQWETVPGDQLPAFMETAIRENDYVLIICTPKYKERADLRKGGIGYEGDIITGEMLHGAPPRKFIPVLRRGSWDDAAPTWCKGKYYVDLRGDPVSEAQYSDLLTTILGTRATPPKVSSRRVHRTQVGAPTPSEDFPVRILGVTVDEVTEPRMDGTRGSALYRVPFALSRTVSPEWARIFEEVWNHPPKFTSMHRPGIARASGDRIILDGTTMEEVKKYHRHTLKLTVSEANRIYGEQQERQRREAEERERLSRQHSESVQSIASELNFEDEQ